MKLATTFVRSGDLAADVARVRDLERAGLDLLWVPEAYSFDSVSLLGFLAARTTTLELGSGIINVFSRTAPCVAQTAAGLDDVSGGRFVLGLGASGPQVVEGFFGVPFDRPLSRIRDYIAVCRTTWRREPVVHDGPTVRIPLPAGEGTGLGKPLKLINRPHRADIPIFWASLMGRSVAATAEHADGWLPIYFDPDRYRAVWGDDLDRGLARRDPALGPLQISAGGLLAIGEHLTGDGADAVLDLARPDMALHVGGMGARGANYYNTICERYGFAGAAAEVQDHYLAGRRDQAAAALPRELLAGTNLVGPRSYVAERIAAYAAAGVTHLAVTPVGADPVALIAQVRELL